MKKFILGLFIVALLSGCSTYKAVTSSPMLEATVRISVGRVLENNPSWVVPAYDYTKMAIGTIEGQEIVNLDIIDTLFVSMIKDQLIPEEQDLALMLFNTIKQSVIDDLNLKGISDPGQQALYAIQVLSWINQSASLRMVR